MLNLILDICKLEYGFRDFEECRNFFKELINYLRQMNYAEFHSEGFEKYKETISKLLDKYGK